MTRQLLCVVIGAVLGAAGYAVAQQGAKQGHPEETKTKVVLEQVLAEKLDGHPAKVVLVEVDKVPGAEGAPHRHPGPVVGYVLEGEVQMKVGDGAVKTYKKGEAFFEPARALHAVSRNPSKTAPARFLAFMLIDRDEKRLVLPEKP
jgi:quercetin dioxygenase-like cupin family protein